MNEYSNPKKRTQPLSVTNSTMNGTDLMTFTSVMITEKTYIANSGASLYITNDDTRLYNIYKV